MNEAIEVILRTVGAFVLMLIIARLVGRRTVAQLRVHDYITGTMLSTLAGNMAFNIKIGSFLFTLSIVILGGMSIGLLFVEMRSRRTRKWIEGEAVTVIENGSMLEETMKKHKFTKDSLLQQLRSEQIFDPSEVEKAVLEKSGQLSVLKKPEYRPLTPDTIKSFMKNGHVPVELVLQGSVVKETLKGMGRSEAWLREEAGRQGYRLKDISYAVQGSDGTIYFIPERSRQDV